MSSFSDVPSIWSGTSKTEHQFGHVYGLGIYACHVDMSCLGYLCLETPDRRTLLKITELSTAQGTVVHKRRTGAGGTKLLSEKNSNNMIG